MTDSADWWDHRPVFSANDKGSRITGLAPGERPGTISKRLRLTGLLCFAAWGALAFFSSSLLCTGTTMPAHSCSTGLSDGWLTALVVVAVGLALLVTVDLAEHARAGLGQRRAASLFWSTALLAGIAVGGLAAVGRQLAPERSETLRRTFDFEIGTESLFVSTVVAILAAAWALVNAARLPSAVRQARQRQATIERLRRDGTRHTGHLRLGRIVVWLGNNPELDVTVTYEASTGPRELRARMRTSPDRVPVDGSSIVVLTDPGGAVQLELDRDAETVFGPEERYAPSE